MKTIGRYIIRGLLGKGGMARVYKVEIPVIRKIAALKLFAPHPHLVDLMGEDTLRNLFVQEALTMSRLRHPGIAEIWDFDEHDRQPFYLMDYYCQNLGQVIGETYRTEEVSRVLPVEDAIRYISQTLSAMGCLHQAGIIHRDIKPFNLLLTDQDQVKICDFGLSRLRGETFPGPATLKVGSPFYAAPEQETDPDQADQRADLYSAGVMLYRFLTGHLPESGFSHASMPDLSGMEAQWRPFFQKALDSDPQKRFQTAKEMAAELSGLETAWAVHRENVCALPDAPEPNPLPRPAEPKPIRSVPIKVLAKNAREAYRLTPRWQPEETVANAFTGAGSAVIRDESTGLAWQQSAAPYPLTWDEAAGYIDRLNRQQYQGYQNWRLPTIDELLTLFTEYRPAENLCLESVFDTGRTSLWSCDRRSYTSAWFVNMQIGYVAANDMSSYYYVKAVCHMDPL